MLFPLPSLSASFCWASLLSSLCFATVGMADMCTDCGKIGIYWALSSVARPRLLLCLFTCLVLPLKSYPSSVNLLLPSSIHSSLSILAQQPCFSSLLATSLLSSVQLYILLIVNHFALLSVRIFPLYIQKLPASLSTINNQQPTTTNHLDSRSSLIPSKGVLPTDH